MLIAFLVLWLIQAIYIYGTALAYFQERFPDGSYEEDVGNAVLFAVFFGWIPVIMPFIILCSSGFNKYGWRVK